MKRILPEFEFSDEQLNIVRKLASECGLCEDTVKILYGRGICTKQEITDFMNPSKEHFISPFKMSGMREAVELITMARDEEWSVVVYGDYDADGVCAATILGNSLRDFGIEPYICVPERKDGYGLSAALIDAIFDEYFPQLFITVDCGISCADEVNYIKEMGAEVIVTDHHELPERIPDCICINPKFNDGYIYDNLCGAGVAFKVGCALNGESAYKYLDFAAIATVADSVPLTGENRDIVYEGLKLINSNPRECYSYFLNKNDCANSHTLAFSVAPKINAAGRMGDAKSALTLFNSTDRNEIFTLASKLTEYNLERQKYCDELYNSAKEMLKERGGFGNIIMLYNESWNAGFVGIVAARLADEFSRPAILFVKNGDTLKGSARSVENVNIFEALRHCNGYITEFGGHSQAAGVNVSIDNFEPLYEALETYISENYTAHDFIPTVYISGVLSGAYSARFVKELERLEPFGVGNKRPVFELDGSSLAVKPVKPLSPHLNVKSDSLDLMYFGGSKFSCLLESCAPKKLIFEYNVSSFRGKEYVKGFIRDIIYPDDAGKFIGEDALFNAVSLLPQPKAECEVTAVSKEETENALKNCGNFGIVFIGWNYPVIESFEGADRLPAELFYPSSKNNSSLILIAPMPDADLSGFSEVIFLENPVGVRLPTLSGKRVKVCATENGANMFKPLTCERQILLKIFAYISANENILEGVTAEEVAKKSDCGYSKAQVLLALKIFEQLSLVSFKSGRLKVIRGVKSELTNSEIYNTVLRLTTE